ncbi:leucine-rich repeat extensin-like protein 5 isoform X2 [Hyalella azteca]|uniref:Leucine-rich repeat extensin-like protein 5 isoform X2 n=1 Tax=Hyalella azteca TaxID=294128 RepID=A0A8B7NVD4_HYAAZ|nr:leucine-rich repeat extensin-like protein 5 isoform X2 [Hyalella azteca]
MLEHHKLDVGFCIFQHCEEPMRFVTGYTGHVQGAQEDCGRSVVDFARHHDSPSPHPGPRPHGAPHDMPPPPYQHLSSFPSPGNPLFHPYANNDQNYLQYSFNSSGNFQLDSFGKTENYPKNYINDAENVSPNMISNSRNIPINSSANFPPVPSGNNFGPYLYPSAAVSPGYSHILYSPSRQLLPPQLAARQTLNDCISMSTTPRRSLAVPHTLASLPPPSPPTFLCPPPARFVP